jgi:hypothetical protein
LIARKRTLSGSEILQFLNREIEENDAAVVLEDIRQQVAWRESQLLGAYPFTLSQGNMVRKVNWSSTLPYMFMLLLSFHSYYEDTTIKNWNNVAKLFESLVSVSLKLHLGNAIRIGSPRIPSEAPVSFRKCIAHVCKTIKEREGSTPEIPWHKDGGVDVIGWRRFDDRVGKVIFLVQCAAGENWSTKERVPIESWKRWIFFATNPIEALAFPFVYSIKGPWDEASWFECCQGRVLMDRLRLAIFDSRSLQGDLKAQTLEWCKGQISKLPPM